MPRERWRAQVKSGSIPNRRPSKVPSPQKPSPKPPAPVPRASMRCCASVIPASKSGTDVATDVRHRLHAWRAKSEFVWLQLHSQLRFLASLTKPPARRAFRFMAFSFRGSAANAPGANAAAVNRERHLAFAANLPARLASQFAHLLPAEVLVRHGQSLP